MNDFDVQQWEAEDRAAALIALTCGCVYDRDFDETTAVCGPHRRVARYVGGVTEYVIDGLPLAPEKGTGR